MGLYEGQGQLAKGYKDLIARWHATKLEWRDSVGEAVERDTLEPLGRDLQAAVTAMDHMATVVKQARRDCS